MRVEPNSMPRAVRVRSIPVGGAGVAAGVIRVLHCSSVGRPTTAVPGAGGACSGPMVVKRRGVCERSLRWRSAPGTLGIADPPGPAGGLIEFEISVTGKLVKGDLTFA